MTETRKLAAILVADVVGYSRLAGIDEEGTLARLRTLRSDLIDPTISVHHGRIVKRTGDGSIVEFRSVVDAVRCAIEVQNGLKQRNSGVPPEKRIEFRVGLHVGDVVEESDGDLMGDGVNIAARLEGVARPGGICLSEDAWRHAQGKVEARFTDAGAQRLKNIASPVRAFLWAPDEAVAPQTAPLARRLAAALGIGAERQVSAGVRMRWTTALIGLLILVTFAASAAWVRFWPTFQGPGAVEPPSPVAQRSIAVLPFRNVSGDKEQDYFADGLSGDLITRLSQISDLFVIARSSMSAYKDRSVAPQEVGQKLGVRYVLEGSVQRSGDRMRINANLIEARDARQIWAEQFDEEVSNIFVVQDKVINRIVSVLTVRLTDIEQTKIARASTKNLEAYDYYLRAENEGYYNNLKAHARALAFYGKAIELDPNFADAQAGYALMAVQVSRYSEFGMSPPVARKRAYDAAGHALETDPNNSRAYVALAVLQLGDGRHADAIASARRAVSLGPSDPEALANLGMILAYSGEPTEAVSVTEQALRLSPSPTPTVRQLAGIVFYNARQYERSITEMKAVLAVQPDAYKVREHLAAAYAHLGRLDLARSEAEAIPEYAFPKPSLAFARLWYQPYYKRAEDLNRHLEGLKAAGIPEWPFGFEGNPEDQVTGRVLSTLAVGRTWAGYIPARNGGNTPFILQIDKENRIVYRSAQAFLAGVVAVEKDRLCVQFEGELPNLWLCGAIYRVANKVKDATADYVYVLPTGLRYFSVKD
jgi:adenylate cyclase